MIYKFHNENNVLIFIEIQYEIKNQILKQIITIDIFTIEHFLSIYSTVI